MRTLTTVLLGLSFLVTPAVAADAPAKKIPAVSEKMAEFVKAKEVAGAVTVVADRDGILHFDTVGLADVEADKPMAPDTIFWIASMTKPVTGACIMMLQDEGKLNVDDPVARHIPEFANLKKPDGTPANLTIRHLLTHTSGLAEAPIDVARSARTLSDLVPSYLAKPVAFEPGSQWKYCQSGINTAGRIVEVVSGKDFPTFAKERLFEPLGMKDTTFYLTPEQLPRLAKSYKLDQKTRALTESPIFALYGRDPTSTDRSCLPNGGLFSTAHDYTRFLQMVLNSGTLDGKKYLSPEAVKVMTTVQSGDVKTGFTPGNGWGIGWCVVREPQDVTEALSPGTAGHGGAFGTQAWADPVKGRAYVLMVQRANFPNSDGSTVRKEFQNAAAKALDK